MASPISKDGFVFDPVQQVSYKILRCEICSKEFAFLVTSSLFVNPEPKNCKACQEKIRQALIEYGLQAKMLADLMENEMCSSNGGTKMLNPFANLLGGLGAAGDGMAASTVSISGFDNVLAAQAQAQQFHQQYAQQIEQLAKGSLAPAPKAEVKEVPKVDLNPKRAVQLEE